MTDDLPPITLPAEHVIPAWRNAYLATGQDDDQPGLHRTVLCEWHEDGLRFTATDGFMLVTSYAAADRWATTNQAPDLDLAPTGAVTVVAADRLMTDFLKHRAAEVKAYTRYLDDKGPEVPGPIDVTFSLGTIDQPNTAQQQLDLGGDDQRRLIVSSDAERIALPLFDGPFPNWRATLAGHRPAPRAQVQARAGLLHRIGQLTTLPVSDDDNWLQLTMSAGGGPVLVTGVGRVPLAGMFAPRREEPADQSEDEAA